MNAIADGTTFRHRQWRLAKHRQAFGLPKIISIRQSRLHRRLSCFT